MKDLETSYPSGTLECKEYLKALAEVEAPFGSCTATSEARREARTLWHVTGVDWQTDMRRKLNPTYHSDSSTGTRPKWGSTASVSEVHAVYIVVHEGASQHGCLFGRGAGFAMKCCRLSLYLHVWAGQDSSSRTEHLDTDP